MLKCWMRELVVILYSKKRKKKIVFGRNYLKGKEDLSIGVTGTKYMASLKDQFQITISNLTISEILEIIDGEYYEAEIICGYRSADTYTLFKGEILNISDMLGDRKSNDVVITVASKFMARMGQSRLNLTLNSGINLYNAIKFVASRSGVGKIKVSEDLKSRLLNEVESINKTSGSWIEVFSKLNGIGLSSDSSVLGDNLTAIDLYRNNNRVIRLQESNIILTGGYPRLTSEGLQISLMPTFNFMPTDTIIVDNSIIDIGSTGTDSKQLNIGNYLDRNGRYMITQIDYVLSNREATFSLTITAKSRSLISNTLGLVKENNKE